MKIITKPVIKLSPKQYAAVRDSNFHYGGLMLPELDRIEAESDSEALAIMLWTTTPTLIGWALLTPVKVSGPLGGTEWTKRRSKYTVQVYVNDKYRRNGYGKLLMTEAIKHDPRPHVIPHDVQSGELFSSFTVTTVSDDAGHLRRGKPKVA